MTQVARQYWGHIGPEKIAALPYAFWPTLEQDVTIDYPEDLLMTDAYGVASVATEGLHTCHALVIGALRNEESVALYISHNYADESAATVARARKALAFMTATRHIPVIAAIMGPSDEWLGRSRFTKDASFEQVVAPLIRECAAEVGIDLVAHHYGVGLACNGLKLIRQPNSDEPFSLNVLRAEKSIPGCK